MENLQKFTCLSTFLHFILLNLKVVTKVLIDSQNIKVSKVYHSVAQKTPSAKKSDKKWDQDIMTKFIKLEPSLNIFSVLESGSVRFSCISCFFISLLYLLELETYHLFVYIYLFAFYPNLIRILWKRGIINCTADFLCLCSCNAQLCVESKISCCC